MYGYEHGKRDMPSKLLRRLDYWAFLPVSWLSIAGMELQDLAAKCDDTSSAFHNLF